MFGMFFLGTLYLQRVLGYDAVQTGAAFLPVSVGIGALSLGFSARLITRFGARAVLLPGLVLLVAGLVLLTGAPVGGDYVTDLLPAMVLLGVGAGLAFPALMTLAMSGATAERLGPGLGPRQHDPAGRRRARPRRAGHAVDLAHRPPAGRRRRAPRRRSPAATTWPSPSAPGSWSPRSWSRRSSCAPSGVALQEAPAVDGATEEVAYSEAA